MGKDILILSPEAASAHSPLGREVWQGREYGLARTNSSYVRNWNREVFALDGDYNKFSERLCESLGTSFILVLGLPSTPIVLYPYLKGIARGEEILEVSSLSEWVLYLGPCSDSLARISGCSSCISRHCHGSSNLLAHEEDQDLVYNLLEKEEGYTPPSALDGGRFAPKRMFPWDADTSSSWDNAEGYYDDRRRSAAKAAKTRRHIRTKCTKCVLYQKGVRCWYMSKCKSHQDLEDVEASLQRYAKSEGISYRWNSYVAQANIRLTGRVVCTRIGSNRTLQHWWVAYCFKGTPKRVAIEKVHPYYTDYDKGKIPYDVYVVLYKSHGAYSAGDVATVRLRDLLQGLRWVKGTGTLPETIRDKKNWKKVSQDALLIQAFYSSHEYARKASWFRVKYRSYYLHGAYTGGLLAQINHKGNALISDFTPTKGYSADRVSRWSKTFGSEVKSIRQMVGMIPPGSLRSTL